MKKIKFILILLILFSPQISFSGNYKQEGINDLKEMIHQYSRGGSNGWNVQELSAAKFLLTKAIEPEIMKNLTSKEKHQINDLSSKVEEAEKKLSREQLASVKQLALYFNAKWEGDYGKELSKADVEQLNRSLCQKWKKMVQALGRRDIEEAVSYFSDSTRNSYRKQFTFITPKTLDKIVRDLNSPITLVKVTGNTAIYGMRRMENGKMYSYQLMFSKDLDGEWRINRF